MAANPAVMYRGAAATSSATLYTVPTSTTAVVTSVVIANNAATSATVTIKIDGASIVPASTIAANSNATFDIRQTMAAGKTITGFASATTVDFHISGMEVTA